MAEEVNFNLGIDFGTSYTKVCIQGDDDPETSDVINFGGEAPNQGMLPDVVYRYGSNGLVSTTYPDNTNLEVPDSPGIKVLLKRKSEENIKEKEKKIDQRSKSNFSLEEIENVCAYYLAQVISKAKNRFGETKGGKQRLKGKTPKWTANIGVPVEYYDSPILAYFHRVLHLALHLEQKNLEEINKDSIPYSEIKKHLNEIRSVYKEQFQMEKHLEEFSKEELKQHVLKLITRNDKYNTVLPEIESIVRPFIDNPKGVTEGMYFFFDIGGGTVDGTACYLRASGRELVPEFFHSTVTENGVDTLDCSRELVFQEKLFNEIKEVEKSLPKAPIPKDPEIKSDYRTNPSRKEPKELELPELPYPASRGSKAAIDERVKSKQNKEDETILKIMLVKLKLQQQVGEVIMRTGYQFKDFQKRKLHLIIFGGGANSPFYRKTLPETYYTFKQYRAWVPEYQINQLNFDSSGLRMNGLSNDYFDRYLIAYGLSYPRGSKSNISRSYYDPKEESQSSYPSSGPSHPTFVSNRIRWFGK